MLDINGRLDFDTILEMYKRGHTRIPVCDGDPQNPQVPIVGLVLTKDLMLVDPDDQLETRTFLHYCGRPIRAVSEDLPLNEMLEMVIAGPEGKGNQTHMFFVQPEACIAAASADLDPVAVIPDGSPPRLTSAESFVAAQQKPLQGVIGLVTLEDVLEELIQTEIVDETDTYLENDWKDIIPRGKREVQEMQEREAFFRAMVQKGSRRTCLNEGEVSTYM